jgi:hypothetical protein
MDSWEDLDEETVPLPAVASSQPQPQPTKSVEGSVWGPAPSAPTDALPAYQYMTAQAEKSPVTKILMRPTGAASKQSGTRPPVQKTEQEILAELQQKEKSYDQVRQKIFGTK